MESKVRDIKSKQELDELIAGKKLVVMDAWATWCGPCRMLAPTVERLNNKYAEEVEIVKVNVDENTEIISHYGIRNIPTVLFIKDGEVVDKLVGAAQESQYFEKVEELK